MSTSASTERAAGGRVEGKTVLVTGGARGMGAAHARKLVAEGARVVVADVLEDEGRAVAREIGPNAHFLRLDVTRPEDWQRAVEETEERFGPLDALVNNAGLGGGSSTLLETDLASWQAVIDVNLTGMFLGLQAAVRSMGTRGGSIVNVSSIFGLRGMKVIHAYVASKFAVRGLAKSVALEVADLGIRVNSIHPGMILTPMVAQRDPSVLRIPMGRTGQPEEVSDLVLFLVSDESAYCTGSEFTIDGGLTAAVPVT
ncbi:glucose 1-dehydrogenase [Streptomyces mirabilis]|uniref:glucose 1-dehydrogenase n=1 Tax=Streptomyces mirabilis TaxID=68239 RepID=UPI00365265DC